MRVLARASMILAILAGSFCSPFPRDPKETLERATGSVLKVGVSENYPWVIRRGDDPAGVEPELVRRFAESIDADVEWIWGSPEEHFAALEHWDLHLAITGLTNSSPWRKRLGLTQPYHTSDVVIARPPSDEPVSEIDGLKILVPDHGGYAGWVRAHDGVPVPVQKLDRPDALAAIDDWEVEDAGLFPTGVVIHTHERVIAVPPGENRFLVALENVLHEADIAPLIEKAKRHRKPMQEVESVEPGGSS